MKNDMTDVKISVIVPCHNVVGMVGECLESIVNQTIGLSHLEIILVDDASTDNTVDVLKYYEQKYSDNIMLVLCDKNGRQGTARNIGMSYATGNYISFVDSDDWIHPDMYKILAGIMMNNSCDIVQFRYKETKQLPSDYNRHIDNVDVKIYDYAKLIPDDKEKEIYNMIKKFISKYNMDMAIVTINENPKSSSMGYADDFYDYNDFGVGVNKNGLLFLIDMDNRKMWISTTGKAIEIYNDKRIDAILDYTYDKISKKDYSGCAEQFIKYATYFAKKGRNGGDTIISTSKMIKSSLICSSIATAIFIIIGVCSHRKPQKNREASKYISKPLKLTEQTDQFLDKHVSQTRRVESSSSSGESSGSSTHSGSSGTSHGGGGRSF